MDVVTSWGIIRRMPNTEHCDVAIIGAGLSGLSCAAYLADSGKHVIIVDSHRVPGGYAHEFRRGKYRFEVSLHALDGAGPGGWAYPVLHDLGVLERVPFRRLDPFYTAQFPEHEVVAHADLLEYEADLVRQFRREQDGIRSLFDAMWTVFMEVRRFVIDSELSIQPPFEEIPGKYPNLVSAMSETWATFMDRYVADERLKAMLSVLWSYYGLPPDELSAGAYILPFVSYHAFGAFYPEGGSMAMSRALESELLGFGGEIRYGQIVERIETNSERAVAIETNKGLRIEADAVVSGASNTATLLQMLDEGVIPAAQKKKLEEQKPSAASLLVYLGVERDLIAEGWPHHELFSFPSYDCRKSYDAAMRGNFRDGDLLITHYTHCDPTCAPKGSSVLSLFSLASWEYEDVWGTGGDMTDYRKNERYNAVKNDAAAQLLDVAERHIPGLRDSIKFMEVGTPLTNARYSRNPAGAIYGSAQTVDNMFMSRQDIQTPVPNLFLTGAWVQGGGQSAALLSGRETARAVIRHVDGEQEFRPGLLTTRRQKISPPSNPPTMPRSAARPELVAVGTDRLVRLEELGVPAIFVLHTQETTGSFNRVNRIVRKRHKDSMVVLTGSIVDLSSVPEAFRPVAQASLQTAFDKSAMRLKDGQRLDDHVLILPDWEGTTAAKLGFGNLSSQAVVIAIGADGKIIDTYQGEEIKPGTIELLEKLNL